MVSSRGRGAARYRRRPPARRGWRRRSQLMDADVAGDAVLSAGHRPSAVWRVARSPHVDNSTPWAPASRGISRMPLAGSFHSATTLDGACPFGRDRSTMPKDVNVRTAEPGSSARTLA
jgi:hypothetical protein